MIYIYHISYIIFLTSLLAIRAGYHFFGLKLGQYTRRIAKQSIIFTKCTNQYNFLTGHNVHYSQIWKNGQIDTEYLAIRLVYCPNFKPKKWWYYLNRNKLKYIRSINLFSLLQPSRWEVFGYVLVKRQCVVWFLAEKHWMTYQNPFSQKFPLWNELIWSNKTETNR